MIPSEQCLPISNPILRRKLSLLKAYGKTINMIKKRSTVKNTHCFELWAEGRPVETISLKLTDREATQLEKEIADWLSRGDKMSDFSPSSRRA